MHKPKVPFIIHCALFRFVNSSVFFSIGKGFIPIEKKYIEIHVLSLCAYISAVKPSVNCMCVHVCTMSSHVFV